MRILLPTIATALIVLVALWPQLSDQQRRFSISPTKVTREAARNLTLKNSVFSGVDSQKRPYSVTSDSARVAVPGNNCVARQSRRDQQQQLRLLLT